MDEGTVSMRVVYHVILLWLLSTLLGTQNPELFGLENKVLRVVLGWDPLRGLRLAKIEGKNQWSRTTRSTGKLTHSNPILFGTRH